MLLLGADSSGGSFTVAPDLALVLWSVLFIAVIVTAMTFAARWALRQRQQRSDEARRVESQGGDVPGAV